MTIKRLLGALSAVLVTLLGVPSTAQAAATIDKTVRDASARRAPRQRVIVRYRSSDSDKVRRAIAARAGRIYREHPNASALAVEMNGADLSALAATAGVEGLSADAIVSADATRTVAVAPGLKGGTLRKLLGVDTLPTSGAGVVVAVIDSGIRANADFRDRIIAAYDFTSARVVRATATDPYGHGTHVAGLIAGSGATSAGLHAGVAPGVKLVSMKVLDAQGRGYTSDVIEALDFAVANRAALRIQVINLSLGHPILEPAATDPLVQAVERATAAGLIVVTAAGNIGQHPQTGQTAYAGITSPGNAPSAITVGAVSTQDTVSRRDDRIAAYSSRGPSVHDAFVKPDVVAPGSRLVSVASAASRLYLDYPELRTGGGAYMTLSGTSMATGVVSGLVALVLEAHKTGNTFGSSYSSAAPLTSNLVKGILQYSSTTVKDDNGGELDTLTQGAGLVNGAGAVTLANAIDTSAPYGHPWLRFGPTPSTSFGGETVSWTQHVLWGRFVLSGALMVYNRPVWNLVSGTHIVWSSMDDHIVWGADDHIVWGAADHIVWGADDHIVWGADEHIVWGADDHIVWGSSDDHIVWGADDHVVWGNMFVLPTKGNSGTSAK